MKGLLQKSARIRLSIAIQVFTTLLILVVGYFVIEGNLRELIEMRQPVPPFQLKATLLTIRAEVLLVAFIAFVSGLVLSFTIRREVKRAIQGVQRISMGMIDPEFPQDLSREFVPLNVAIKDLGEALNRFLEQSITNAIIMVNDDLSVDVLNPAAEVLLGYRSEEISGKAISALFPEGQSNKELHTWLKARGEAADLVRPQAGVLLSGSGEWMHMRLATFQVHRQGRRLRGIVAGVFDVEEWHRIREEFDRARRLSSLGLMASGLAHEIKNPLGSIHGLVQMLAEDISKEHPKRRYYDTILEEVERLDGIMKRLLDLGSPCQWRFQVVELKAVVEEVETLMKSEANQRCVTLKGEIQEDSHCTVGDTDRIKQAMINVLKNAIEATPQGEVVAWTLGADGPWIIFSVQNPGASIPESIASNISQGFFSSKSEGSGLGLAITNQILHQHGGHLRIQNLGEKGVLVRLFFPIKYQRDIPSEKDRSERPGET